jgi:hypothetical protein
MNTSGVADPPEMSVASVARLVSVLVGAEVSVTWMFGYRFSKSLISTWRTSLPLVLIGLAHQLIDPEVADPVAVGAAVGELLLPPPLLQPATPDRRGHPGQGGQPPSLGAGLCRVFWVIPNVS